MLYRCVSVNWYIKYEWVPELKNASIQAIGYIVLYVILSSIYKPVVMYFLMLFQFQLFYLVLPVGRVLFIGWWHRQYIIVNWKLWEKWKCGQGRIIFSLVSSHECRFNVPVRELGFTNRGVMAFDHSNTRLIFDWQDQFRVRNCLSTHAYNWGRHGFPIILFVFWLSSYHYPKW